jgi:hypothetical protein
MYVHQGKGSNILPPQMTQMAQILGHNCASIPIVFLKVCDLKSSVQNSLSVVSLLPYAYRQHMNVLKHSVYVQYGCGKQFEVAVSHHNDIMI